MTKLEVFDPPMCCSTGVCGPKVDPELTRFAADLKWFANQGVTVMRYNLAQQPLVFAENDTVKTAMSEDETCLPIVLVDGQIVSRAKYPTRGELAVYICIAMRARNESPKDKAPALADLADRQTKGDNSMNTAPTSCCGPWAARRKGSACCG